MLLSPPPLGSGIFAPPNEHGEDHPTSVIGLALEGRYELLELLSEGGMGTVYRARHRQLHRLVAIKFMSAHTREDPELRERFMHEARIASSLEHPNVVSVTDFGIDPERGYFLVMELLAGQSLRERMIDGPLKPRVACDIMEQTAWALRYIHARGVIHCDLKPENVFLVRAGEESRRRNHVKLIDFGLAFNPTERGFSLAGTPPYLAPERLRGAPPSPAADLYSLGAMFYEILTGKRPFDGTMLEVVDKQLAGRVPRAPSVLVEGEPLEPRTDDVVMRTLAFDPAQRPQTAESFLFELRTLMSMMGMRVRRVSRGSAAFTRRLQAVPRSPHAMRQHDRVPVALPVKVRRRDSQPWECCTENLSAGGAFLTLPTPLPLGEEIDIDLPLTNEAEMSVRAIVRWVRPAERDHAPGCGIEFLDLSDTMRLRIREASSP